ncbi:hypothetical protein VTO42DRAFT_4145 [Malbranchea cinnamomea]
MGSICSKGSIKPDPFSQPGRVLGSNADTPKTSRAPVPRNVQLSGKSTTQGGRTLGGTSAGGASDPRSAAARAAEERAAKQAKSANKGKLSSQLAAQKAKTRNEVLDEASRQERAARNADAAAEARRWE